MLNAPTAPKLGATMREIANDENYASWQRYQDGERMKGEQKRGVLEGQAKQRQLAGLHNQPVVPVNSPERQNGEVRDQLAAEVGVGQQKYDNLRKVATTGSPALKKAVDEKKIGASTAAVIAELPEAQQDIIVEMPKAEIVAVAKEVRPQIEAKNGNGKPSIPTFNRTNDSIEWALWTWNPVVGCKFGCPYCYARDIANRFYGHFLPTFYSERLAAPANTKPRTGEPNNVFVCSMADLFGDWVPDKWIEKVFAACEASPQWNYLFLTKNPERYAKLHLPANSWVGATVDTQARYDRVQKAFAALDVPNIKFISFEPLSEHITATDIPANWVIIGGRSNSSQLPEMQPQWPWVEEIVFAARQSGAKVYFKPNLTARPKEYPRQAK